MPAREALKSRTVARTPKDLWNQESPLARQHRSGGDHGEPRLGQAFTLALGAAAGAAVLFTLPEHEPTLHAMRRQHAQALAGLKQRVLQVPQMLRHVALGYARLLRNLLRRQLRGAQQLRDTLAHRLPLRGITDKNVC